MCAHEFFLHFLMRIIINWPAFLVIFKLKQVYFAKLNFSQAFVVVKFKKNHFSTMQRWLFCICFKGPDHYKTVRTISGICSFHQQRGPDHLLKGPDLSQKHTHRRFQNCVSVTSPDSHPNGPDSPYVLFFLLNPGVRTI